MITLMLGLFACGEKEQTCRLDDECQSGICGDDGFCEPVTNTDTGTVEDTGDTNTDSSDSSDSSEDTGEDTSSGLCVPNHDGLIERSEYPLEVGISVNFGLVQNSQVDLTGGINTPYYWDLTGPYNNDSTVVVTPTAPAAFWFGDSFPNSTYVTVLSYESETYGIFTLNDDGVFLDGVASFEEGLFETELQYDPAVPILQFPVQEGNQWEIDTTITGTLNGAMTYYFETYNSQIDKAGTLKTAMGEFPVLRLNTTVDRLVGFYSYTNHSIGFIAECYGTVATVSSELDETESEFSQASQLLRIVP